MCWAQTVGVQKWSLSGVRNIVSMNRPDLCSEPIVARAKNSWSVNMGKYQAPPKWVDGYLKGTQSLHLWDAQWRSGVLPSRNLWKSRQGSAQKSCTCEVFVVGEVFDTAPETWPRDALVTMSLKSRAGARCSARLGQLSCRGLIFGQSTWAEKLWMLTQPGWKQREIPSKSCWTVESSDFPWWIY